MLKLPLIAKINPSPARNSRAGKPIATGANKLSGIRSYWDKTLAKAFGSKSFEKPAYIKIKPRENLTRH
jgi:hypothetical protein